MAKQASPPSPRTVYQFTVVAAAAAAVTIIQTVSDVGAANVCNIKAASDNHSSSPQRNCDSSEAPISSKQATAIVLGRSFNATEVTSFITISGSLGKADLGDE
ncbi:hypothetical protein TIFTF001_032881 [Ficus carica]|uniref:Uncharacterized protein n=1 Tax=Ficus carica TaxID=3494 RepID=A0AA88DXX6_FICCA|nr:hypothetical protein TIFTF001_032881 [Ficus carica]